MSNRFRERPLRRVNPSGKVVWVARVTRPDGRREAYKPAWNSGKGTFPTRGEAQRAIDEYYDELYGKLTETVDAYFDRWPKKHPRAARTQATNEHRVSRTLDIEIEGRKLRDWPLVELRRRHALDLLDVLLRDQGRSALGARHILNALALMTEDAITDEVADVNPFRGIRVRANDPRIRKQPRQIRVWSFEDMHRFAKAAGPYEALVRCFSDLGLRLGEALPLERGDLRRDDRGGWVLGVHRTAHEGVVQEGTKTDHGEVGGGRIVPVSPSFLEVLYQAPARIDTLLLYPTPTGKLWRERNFYRDVWQPARDATQLDIRPHEMRHSWISHLRAAGIDDADLADVAGHTVETMLGHYTHALKQSFDAIRRVIG